MGDFTKSKHYSRHPTLKEALDRQACLGSEPKVFGFDVPTNHANGKKFFVLAGYDHFWARFSLAQSSRDRTANEILLEDLPTKMYFDIDLPKSSRISFRVEKTVQVLLEHMRDVLDSDVPSFSDTTLEWNMYDSVSDKKYSYHLVFQNVVMEDVAHCGALYRRIEMRLRNAIRDGLIDESLFFYTTDDGIKECVLDFRVYTRKRLFRTLYSRKHGRDVFLLPLDELEYQSSFERELGETQKLRFLESLLQHFPASSPPLVHSILEVTGKKPIYTTHTAFRLMSDQNARRTTLNFGSSAGKLDDQATLGLTISASQGVYQSYRVGSPLGDSVTGLPGDTINVGGREIPKLCILMGNELGHLLQRRVLYYTVSSNGCCFRYQWNSRECYVHGIKHKSNHTLSTVYLGSNIAYRHSCYHDDAKGDLLELPAELTSSAIVQNALSRYVQSLVPTRSFVSLGDLLAPVIDLIPLD